MQKAAYIVSLLLLLTLPSCRNTAGSNLKTAESQAKTAHLKDSSLCFTQDILKTTSAEVRDFYHDHGNVTVWTTKTDRIALHEAITGAEADGLLSKEYNLNFLKEFEALNSITEDEALRYDLMMTEAFRNLATHLFKGRLKPSGVYSDWALSSKPFEADKLLSDALKNHKVADAINRCRPRHEIYSSLRHSLAVLNSLPDDSTLPKIIIEKSLTFKDSSATVAAIKQRLAYWGDLKADTITSIYDEATVIAVKNFQERHGLHADGTVGKQVANLLNISRNERREQVIANLERWRWFPYDFGERALLINIPTYRLAVLENGKDTVQTYKVVVGKPERKSPILDSKITNLVINPTWTVPPTIIKEDLTPAATKDRSYFSSHNMKIYRGDDEIQPEQWKPEEFDKYKYVQGPGNHNSLGRIKFNFYNTFSVYLHDTNHRELFSKGYRALSSGCVRVQDPFKLATYLLEKDDPDWNDKKIQEITDAEATKNVYIQKSIRVHQLYWTAWMDKGGLQFRDDIYSLDKILYSKLRQDL